MVLQLVSLVGLVEGLNVSFGVLLPNFTVPATTDVCPCLRSVEAEADLVRETMKNFTWAEQTANDPVDIQINYHDTQCSDLHGPIVAMDLFYRQTVNVLYGPCCKYALSPVGRYATHWDLPIITPGGLFKPFSNRTVFQSLTRFMPPYDKLIHFFMTYLIDRYNWNHLSLLYHENLKERKVLGYSPCSNLIKTIVDYIEPMLNSSISAAQNKSGNNSSFTAGAKPRYSFLVELFDEHLPEKDFDWNKILYSVQNASRGKFKLCKNDVSSRTVCSKATVIISSRMGNIADE